MKFENVAELNSSLPGLGNVKKHFADFFIYAVTVKSV